MSKVIANRTSGDVVPLRTFDPKFSHYYSNGSGRDNFIMYNNGGFAEPRYHNPARSTAYMRYKAFATVSSSSSSLIPRHSFLATTSLARSSR